MKRIISAVLSAVMMLALVTVPPEAKEITVTETANALASDYTKEQGAAWAKARADEGWEKDVDGVYGCQCVDLTKAYFNYLVGYMPVANANQYMTISLPSGWTRLKSGTPQPGDIVVWDANAPLGGDATWNANATYGHIGIVVENLGATFRTVETNSYPRKHGSSGGPAGYNTRAYYSCLIRPNFKSSLPAGHVMTEAEGAGQTVPDGEYVIYSAVDPEYYIDIAGTDVPAAPHTNVQLYKNNGYPQSSICDRLTFKYLGNGYYHITQYNGNVALDVENGSIYSEANIQAYTEGDINNTAQQWSVKKDGDYYILQARCSGFVIDLKSGKAENGQNIWVFVSNDTKAQRWILRKAPAKPVLKVTAGNSATDTKLNWNECNFANSYDIRFFDMDGEIVYSEMNVKGTSYSVKLPAGKYNARVSAIVGDDLCPRTDSDDITFTVNQAPATTTKKTTTTTKPTTTTAKPTTTTVKTTAAPTTAKPVTTTAAPALSVGVKEITLYEGDQFTLEPNQSGLTFKSNKTDIAIVSKRGVITAISAGDAIITVINADSDAVTVKVKVVSTIRGDTNKDGTVTVADLVMLQKWLNAASKDVTNPTNADMNGDGRLDAFDLVLLRQLVIAKK